MAYAPFAGFSAVPLGAATGSHRLGGQTMGDSPSAWTSGTSTISPSSTTRSRSGTSSGPPLTFRTRDIGVLPYGGGVPLLFDCYCHNCGRPLGKCDLGGVDWTFCRRCAKAPDVYRPPASRRLLT